MSWLEDHPIRGVNKVPHVEYSESRRPHDGPKPAPTTPFHFHITAFNWPDPSLTRVVFLGAWWGMTVPSIEDYVSFGDLVYVVARRMWTPASETAPWASVSLYCTSY